MKTREAVNAALKVIGATGLDGQTIAAPTAQAALEKLIRKTRLSSDQAQRVLAELRRQRLADITPASRGFRFTVTPAGIHRLQNLSIEETLIPKIKKWDKKWRLVSFDVPVSYTKNRAAFVDRLQALGFVMLQKSLWVYPLPCFAQVEKIASHYNVLRYCTLMEVSYIDDLAQRRLSRHFRKLIG